MTALILILSIWSRVSVHFGKAFMEIFQSVHPHPFQISAVNLTAVDHIFGVLLDLLYVIVDSIIFGLILTRLYNWLVDRSEAADKGVPKAAAKSDKRNPKK
jgi:H+/gluconate symporter-like permease